MIHSAAVMLWGSEIGAVYLPEDSDTAYFEYNKDFIHSGIQLSPLMMPLSGNVYSFPALSRESFHGLPGLLSDSLPDRFGNAVIDAWLSAAGRAPESFTAVERLCYTGSRGMGALEYLPSAGPDPGLSEAIDVSEMGRFAERILHERSLTRADLESASITSLLQFGTSAGGARAKGIIAYNDKTGDLRSGQIDAGKGYSYWILKLGQVWGNGDHGAEDTGHYTNVEYAYHLMSKAAGLKMTECRLLEKEGVHHFMTKRFDRDQNGGRIHMQSLGAIAHLDYNVPGACSYERAAGICRRLGLGLDQIQELFRLMVFNVMYMNCDDHVKNLSFLMDKSGVWKLAPPYDISFSYRSDSRWVNGHQMTINGKRRGITLDDIRECARNMDLKSSRAADIIDEVRAAGDDWERYCFEAFVPEKLASNIRSAWELAASGII